MSSLELHLEVILKVLMNLFYTFNFTGLPDKQLYPSVSAVYGNTEVSMVYLGPPLDGWYPLLASNLKNDLVKVLRKFRNISSLQIGSGCSEIGTRGVVVEVVQDASTIVDTVQPVEAAKVITKPTDLHQEYYCLIIISKSAEYTFCVDRNKWLLALISPISRAYSTNYRWNCVSVIHTVIVTYKANN